MRIELMRMELDELRKARVRLIHFIQDMKVKYTSATSGCADAPICCDEILAELRSRGGPPTGGGPRRGVGKSGGTPGLGRPKEVSQ